MHSRLGICGCVVWPPRAPNRLPPWRSKSARNAGVRFEGMRSFICGRPEKRRGSRDLLRRPKAAGSWKSSAVRSSRSRSERRDGTQRRILMHQISRFMLAAAGCLAIAHPSAAAPPAEPLYRVTILSDANASANTPASGNSVDDAGTVTGSYTQTDNAIHASLWAFGQLVDLKTLGKAAALNSRVQ